MPKDKIRDSIITVLNRASDALVVEEIREELKVSFDIERGERSLQAELKQMVDEEELERERLSDGTTGRPPYYYFLNSGAIEAADADSENIPEETALGDDDELVLRELTTSGDVDLQEINTKSVSGLPDGVYWDIVENHFDSSHLVNRIKDAAPEIAELNPLETILDMVEWTVEKINGIGHRLWELHQKGQTGQLRVLRDLYKDLAGWARWFFHEFWQLTPYDRQGPDVLRIPNYKEFLSADDKNDMNENKAVVRRDRARKILEERVFGDKFIRLMSVDESVVDVVGTDSSVASVSLPSRSRLTPETRFELFAGAAALDHDERRFTDFDFDPTDLKEYRRRAALRRGLILSEQSTSLKESQVRQARLAALDLRQYREATRVINDEANWRPHGDVGGELGDYAGSDIMFLDGRLTPLVHLMPEFRPDDVYGELVRREIREFAQLAELARDDSWETNTVFAGVVKQPGISWFASIVFWYLETQYDSDDVERDQDGIIRNISQPPVSDVILPHLLFVGLSDANGPPDLNEVYTTFRVSRRFYDNSIPENDLPPQGRDGKLINVDAIDGWMSYFERTRERREERGQQTIDLEKYRRFGFASACANVGSLMCYVGPPNLYKSHQQGPIRLPRIEVLINPAGDAPEKIKRAASAFALKNYSDDDHSIEGFSALDKVPVVVPRVIVDADKIAKYARGRISEDIIHEIQQTVRELQ